MRFVQWLKAGKRMFCCLLVLLLAAGWSVPLVYAEDTDTSEEQRAVGDIVEVDGILYKILNGYAEVNSDQIDRNLPKNVVISNNISYNGISYPVTRIAAGAFRSCSILSVVIPDSVISLGESAFGSCEELEEVKLSENLQTIGENAFSGNDALRRIVIPGSVTDIGRMSFQNCTGLEELKLSENISTIGMKAFFRCAVKTVEIPNSIVDLGQSVFVQSSLEIVKIPDHVVIKDTFYQCESLKILQIKVSIKEGNVVIPIQNVSTLDNNGFGGWDIDVIKKLNRKLEFWTEDGSARLTGEALKAAQKAYMAVEDGDTGDNLWYGWEVVPAQTAFEVTVPVNKDGKIWTDHNRVFKLTKDNGSSFIEDFSSVVDGTYQIYDFTENANGINTGVTVEVNGSDVTSSPVEYFTVTFYDGVDNPYGADTAWKPQIILNGTYAAEPAAPQKSGYRFDGWKKAVDGQTSFDFSEKITNTTGIYAGWTEIPVKRQYTITASAGEGGSISPSGSVIVEEGKKQEFLIVPDEGYEILSVEVDGVKQETSGSYIFQTVTKDHNIQAEFIKKNTGEIQPPTEPEQPTQPEKPTEPEQPTQPEPPTEPEKPTHPENPTEPEQPTEPENPTTSESPDEPDEPDDFDEPDDSDKPTASGSAGGAKDSEPVTSGLSHVNMYATIGMIAGIFYLMLYFVEKKQGMSEEKKNKLVSSLIAWAKSGAGSQRALKRAVAFGLIVLILCYYHAIGKKLSLEWENLYEN